MYKDAQHRPQGGALGDAAGVSNATSGSLTDRLTREHKMTLDEARLILNVKKTDPMENVLRVRRQLDLSMTSKPESITLAEL